MTSLLRRMRDDRGQALGPEVLLLLVMALVAWGFLSWLGRLTSTGQGIENAAQSAARVASQQSSFEDAERAAEQFIGNSGLEDSCVSTPTVTLSWEAGPTGTWRGGSVTALVSCQIENVERFTTNGRTISASDTQIIDRFRAAP